MSRVNRPLLLAIAALGVISCQRCGAGSEGAPASSSVPSASAPTAAMTTSASASAAAPAGPELPEVRDEGQGRATAALRAALTAHGITFDAETLARECKVDEDGASVDDLEDVAGKYGLDARQIIVPREHVLLPEAKLLPAIVILGREEDDPELLEFVLVWKIEGDRAQIMDPVAGRRWVARMDLEKRIDRHEMVIPAEDWHAAETDPRYGDALRARLGALGVAADQARALVDRATADRGSRGLSALDAALRKLESEPEKAGGDAAGFLGRSLDCALDKRCVGFEPITSELYSSEPARKGADGLPAMRVRGAVVLTIAGKKQDGP